MAHVALDQLCREDMVLDLERDVSSRRRGSLVQQSLPSRFAPRPTFYPGLGIESAQWNSIPTKVDTNSDLVLKVNIVMATY